MWWYYKCVNLIRVLIQAYKQVIFPHIKKCFAKTSRAGGAPPRTDALIGPAAFRDVQKTDCLKRRASGAPFSLLLALWLSWTWLEHLWNSAKLRPPTRAPVRWTLTLKTNHLWSLRPCQSRKITEQRIQRLQSRELSRWRHCSRGFSEGARTDHVKPETKNSRGKTKPTHPACLKPTESK